MIKAYIHASELLTGNGILEKKGRKIAENDLGAIKDGAIVYDKNKILWVGPTNKFPKKYKSISKKNLKNQSCIIPGLIDCHTHLVFAGNRANEFARRCAGTSYQKIAKEGGGILTTVNATQKATESELLKLAIPRVKQSFKQGVRTIEIKSGYGLNSESEIKILKVIKKLKKTFPKMTFVSTFLGAHDFPKNTEPQKYIDEVIDKMLPVVAKNKLADFCDIFVDEGFYSIQQAEPILKKATQLGLKIKLHADELKNLEATQLGVKHQATSVDHLLKISNESIQKLSKSNTVGVLLPGTAFYLKTEQAPARKLLDAGVAIALATDFNPGTCVTLSLPTIMTLAALYLQMSRAEIFAAVTYNAAQAAGLQNKKGVLQRGFDSDFIVLPYKSFEELYYHFAWS